MKELKEFALFRHPRKYYENNLNFRIHSSEAFVRFKFSQSSILKEVRNNPLHKFSKTGVEILLFKYDVWYDFLCKLEQYFLMKSEIDPNYLENVVKQTHQYYYDTLKESSKLDQKYIDIWYTLHGVYVEIFLNYIKHEYTKRKYFPNLVDLFIRLLKETFYEIYELDNLLYRKTIIINLTNFVETIYEKFKINIIERKINIYKKILPNKDITIVIEDDDYNREILENIEKKYTITIKKRGYYDS